MEPKRLAKRRDGENEWKWLEEGGRLGIRGVGAIVSALCTLNGRNVETVASIIRDGGNRTSEQKQVIAHTRRATHIRTAGSCAKQVKRVGHSVYAVRDSVGCVGQSE